MTKFLQDLLLKGALTVDGVVTLSNNTQIGNSRLDVHNIYGAITVGNGSTGTDITALTVKAMGTGGSKNFRVLNTNGDGEVFATQENAFVLIGGTVIPSNGRSGFTFDGNGISPVAFNIVARSNNTGGIFKGLLVTEGNLTGISGGNFDSRYVEVAPTFNATGGVDYTIRGYYYNPTITNLAASSITHYAFESTAGMIKVSDLAGTGSRMVVASATGVLSTQAIPTVSLTDTLDTVTARGATTSNYITVGGVTAGSTSVAAYHTFNSNSVADGSTLTIGANNVSANSSRSQLLLTDLSGTSTKRFGLGVYTSTDPYAYLDASTKLVFQQSGGNVIIGGITDAGYKLDVVGTTRISSSITATGNNHRFGNLVVINSGNSGETGQGIKIIGLDQTFELQGSGVADTMFAFTHWAGTTQVSGLTNANKSTVRIYGGFSSSNIDGLSGNVLNITPTYNFAAGSQISTTRGIYYNPTLTSMVNTTHYAFESTSGKIKISDLAGSGTRMLVADANGVVGVQSISTGSLQGAVDADKNTSGSLSIGTTIVKAVSATTYSGVFFDYVVKNGTNVRVGTVVAISNGTNVEYYETLSNDIGATTNLTFTVTLGSGNINLNAVAAATGWTVIVSTRAI